MGVACVATMVFGVGGADTGERVNIYWIEKQN
ncbi:hypothetical protein J2Y67_005711 [Neobacillus niacini]|nr:hypothetical protein [Neobacillus niacini]